MSLQASQTLAEFYQEEARGEYLRSVCHDQNGDYELLFVRDDVQDLTRRTS